MGNYFVIIRIELNTSSSRKESKLSLSLSLKNVSLLASTLVLLSAGQILVKAGIQNTTISVFENFFDKLPPLFLQSLVLGDLLTTASSTAFYFTVLSEVNLSLVYPFIRFVFSVVLILSSVILANTYRKFRFQASYIFFGEYLFNQGVILW